MAQVVFVRGINVGGHGAFRPSALVRELSAHDIVNFGATGTFVRTPAALLNLVAELQRKPPFEAEIGLCDGDDLVQLETKHPFGAEPAAADVVRFVSVLSKTGCDKVSLPIAIPQTGDCFVGILAAKDPLVFGEYRRHMKSLGYLGRIDELFGAPAITRSWKTILNLIRTLKGEPTITSSAFAG